MLTKKEFKEYLQFIVDRRKKEDNFVDALNQLSKDTYCDCFLYNEYEDKLINLLEIALDDSAYEISYFLYDLDAINNNLEIKNRYGLPEIDGKVLYDSVDTLYDYLVNSK